MLGLQKGVVDFSPHQSDWATLYQQEAQKIHHCIGSRVLQIEHIGSTSIRGILAKPILDIGIAVADFSELDWLAKQLQSLDYDYRGDAGDSGGHVYVKCTSPNVRSHHIHIVEILHWQWKNYLFFRDYMNAHPEMAQQYQELKLDLKAKFPFNRKAYSAGKHDFIRGVLALQN